MVWLYDIGEAVWYYDPYDEVCGIGIISDYSHDKGNQYRDKNTYYSHFFSYIIWDANTTVTYGGFDTNSSLISLKAKDVAPLDAYDNEKEFLKSRGVKRF
tara:strand:- start:97 stop:396 length:300 start_codon:yes stop_codon:yes gene_type:complete